MIAVCDAEGGHEVRWYAGRGRRLADVRCPDHGTLLHGQKVNAPKGPLVACVACGRKRRDGAETCIHPPVAFLIPEGRRRLYLYRQRRVLELAPGPHPVGSVLCAWHPWESVEEVAP